MLKTTNRMISVSLTVLMLLVFVLPARAAPASEQGAIIAARGGSNGALACVSCHGSVGEGNMAAGFPRLAGLDAQYVEGQLNNFASNHRQNAVMSPIAARLTPSERAAVARFYGSLGWNASAAPAEVSALESDVGASLAMRGRWEQNLPACIQCHGAGGQGVGAVFPPLNGQSAAYMAAQLRAFKSGKRPGGPVNLMGAVAMHLSDDDITAVANHFASGGQAQVSGNARRVK